MQKDGLLEVILKDCRLKVAEDRIKTRQFFLMFQMDEQEGSEGNSKIQKFRTDVQLLMPYTDDI